MTGASLGLTTLVNDTHVDNFLKEILMFVYYGSTINYQPKKQLTV